ncbi:transcription antitermination factor NusB [Lichenicoccus sp.]|uniref:transcription antitermination factor NusB n=1 Tax=Lichenicoccus sp. TaxID=2781899 RepID=UPI003D0C3AC5
MPARQHRPGADPTREIAYDILVVVLHRRGSLEDALERADAAVPARDRAAAHRLAATVLRRLGTLDAVLRPWLSRTPPQEVQLLLLLGAAQVLFLQTPAHAAVGTIVDLARARRLAAFSGLVNAVLRRVADTGVAALDGLDQARLDVPAWLWASWGRQARPVAEALRHEAPLDLTLREGAPIPQGGVRLANGSVRLPAGTRVVELPGYEAGAFWVQDAAATLPVRLLAPRPGERIVDLCAAPGGKTAQLAASGAQVTAVDRDPARLARLRQNLERLRLPATVIEADATTWRPTALFDAVLLDAPCSATGTIRRHPDVRHTRSASDLPPLLAAQDRLIAAAAAMLRPGGRLLYAVCSMQREEGEDRINAALVAGLFSGSELGLRPAPFSAAELAVLPEARTADGWLRTHPGLWSEQGGMDGFFAARLLKS